MKLVDPLLHDSRWADNEDWLGKFATVMETRDHCDDLDTVRVLGYLLQDGRTCFRIEGEYLRLTKTHLICEDSSHALRV